MLKYRMLTAFVLLIIIFSMMWLLKPPVFSTVIAIFFIIGAAEWAGLIGIKSVAWRVGYVILVVLLLFAAYFMPPAPCLYAAFIVWLWAAAAVYSYQRGGASLMDFLQAQQEYRAVQVSYVNLVAAFLNAVNQLNLAIGQEVIQ